MRLAVENLYEPDRDPSRRARRRSAGDARAHGDPYTLATVLANRHNVVLSHESVEERRTDGQELERLADELGDPNLRFQARAYGCFWRVQSRDLEGARTMVREGSEISRTLAQPQFEWIATWEDAALVRLAGDLDGSDALVERSREIGAEAGIPDAAFFHGVMRAGALVDRADPATLDEVRGLVAIAPPHYPNILLVIAVLELALGEDPAHGTPNSRRARRIAVRAVERVGRPARFRTRVGRHVRGSGSGAG